MPCVGSVILAWMFLIIIQYSLKLLVSALADVAQWIEHLYTKRSQVQFPDRGICLGCGPGPWGEGGANKRQPHIVVSLSLTPSCSLGLKIK